MGKGCFKSAKSSHTTSESKDSLKRKTYVPFRGKYWWMWARVSFYWGRGIIKMLGWSGESLSSGTW